MSKNLSTNKLRVSRNQTVIAVALVLLLTLSAMMAVMPANAQDKIKTFGYLNVNPKLVGVGQTVIVNAWVTPQPPMTPGTSNGEPRHGYYYNITKPNGEVIVHGPDTSDGPGTDWFDLNPDAVGTWKVKFYWGGDDLYQAVETPEVTFTVQSSPAPNYPTTPLPDGPWTRPISAANREWYQLGGAWIDSTGRDTPCFNPYSQAPASAHINWAINTGLGGLIGGEFGSTAYSSSAPSKVIMMGRAYYSASDGVHCVDVHTGQELWVPAKTMGSGTIFLVPGPTPYIWRIGTSKFERFDAFTGASSKNVTGMPTADFLNPIQGTAGWRQNRQWIDSNGILYINTDDILERFVGTMAYDTKVSSSNFFSGVIWNLQRVGMNSTDVKLYKYPAGNQSTPQIVASYTMPLQDLANMAVDVPNNFIFHSSNGGPYTACINATSGALLWDIARDYYIEGQGVAADGIGSCGTSDTMRVYGFNLTTGAQMWASDQANYPWGAFRAYSAGAAYGKFYHLSYDGTVRAYDEKTGAVVWSISSPADIWGETPYGQWPFYNNPAIADHKVYATTAEHTPSMPLKRGDGLYAVDDTNGKLLWSILGCNSQIAIADGVLVASDSYMPMMYGFAKGETQTTVTASPKNTAKGSSIVIEGTVMDMSPAQPNTPAVSVDSMSAWMEYLHMQQAKPTNTTGVPVQLTATKASDGSVVNLGSATSDANGFFYFKWTPTDQDTYKITATFAGDASYYTSQASTAVNVDPAASAQPTTSPSGSPTGSPSASPSNSESASPTEVPPPDAGQLNLYLISAAAVIVIVVIAVVAVFLRRHK